MKQLIKWEEAAMFALSIVLIAPLPFAWYTAHPALEYAGMILFGHSSMDRAMGYGLKYFTGFQDTHLGKIGKQRQTRS